MHDPALKEQIIGLHNLCEWPGFAPNKSVIRTLIDISEKLLIRLEEIETKLDNMEEAERQSALRLRRMPQL